MLRVVGGRVCTILRGSVLPRVTPVGVENTRASHGTKESDEEFDQRYINFFNRTDLDSWEIRKAMNDLAGADLVPDPTIICAALKACRRLNDYALAVRFLESVKDKCGHEQDKIYPYVVQEIRPVLDELGINTPEELGYDKPELALQSIFDIH